MDSAGVEDEVATTLDSRLERYHVRGDGLEIDVSWWTMTGTTHVADELVIATERGTLRLKDPGGENGELLPLVESIYKVASERWVVLGWSSLGEGMQTEHAWLIGGGSPPRILDKLEWTTDRSHAGVALDAGTHVRIGIPIPVRAADDDETLHNELDWQLVHDKRTYTLAQLAKLPATETHVMALPGYYTPPFHESPSERHWSGRFVWFSAGTRFTLR